MAQNTEVDRRTSAIAPPPNETTAGIVDEVPTNFSYQCRRCRAALFTTGECLPHDASVGRKAFKGARWAGVEEVVPPCTSLFLDPDVAPTWVVECCFDSDVTGSADTIYCPFCDCKIGQGCWSGSQCSCGTWVTPAFKIHAKCVDAMPMPSEA
jgi:dual specificity phosphatase 12